MHIQTFIPVFEAMISLPRSMASSLLALAMQDRAKTNHYFDKGGSMVTNAFFGNCQCSQCPFAMILTRILWLTMI